MCLLLENISETHIFSTLQKILNTPHTFFSVKTSDLCGMGDGYYYSTS